MELKDCYHLGYITKTHGIRGEVSVVLDVDYPEEYEDLESVLVSLDGSNLVPFLIEQISIRGNQAIVKFEEVDDIDAAENLRFGQLYLPLQDLPELEQGQYYYHELVGFQIVDQKHGRLGEVKSIYTLPNNDLLAMWYRNKEILIPLNDDIVKEVDKNNQLVQVELPDGLLEVYL